MEKLCTNKNHSYKHNEQINKQNIDNSECFGVKYDKFIQKWLHNKKNKKYGFSWLYRDFFYISEYLIWPMSISGHSGSYGMVKLVEISRAFYGIVEAAAP